MDHLRGQSKDRVGIRLAISSIHLTCHLPRRLKEELDELQKSDEWFHHHSRLLVLSHRPAVAKGQTVGPEDVIAYGVFRFDTEENEEDDGYDEVLYWYVVLSP